MTDRERIPLIRPYMTDEIKAAVCAVLDSGHLTEGPVTARFEEAVKSYVGCAHAVAVTSCTVGLELALRALGVGPGDEVIVPDFTYPATADAVLIVGATPVIVDVDPRSMLIDLAAVEAAITARTRVVMPVSAFGNPLDHDALDALKRAHGFKVVEDAAPALCAELRGKRVGALADLTVFSFHPRKFITTGEGGMVTTDDDGLAAWMRSYKRFGIDPTASGPLPSFGSVGTNYKLSDVLAAIGVAQLAHVDELLRRRTELAERYAELLRDDPRITLPTTTPGGRHSYQSFVVLIDGRDEVWRRMRADGIEVQVGTFALHREPAFSGDRCRFVGDLAGSRSAFERSLCLPLYHDMTSKEQERVVAALRELL